MPRVCIASATDNLYLAYDAYFKRLKKGIKPYGYPKYIKKDKEQYLPFKDTAKSIAFTSGRYEATINLPKIGPVRVLREKTPLKFFQIRETEVVKEGEKYYVAFCCYVEKPAYVIPKNGTVGVDAGIKVAYTLSDGVKFDNEHAAMEGLRRVAREQRKLDRMTKGGKNWEKQKKLIAGLCKKIAEKRKHFAGAVSKYVTDNYDTIKVEDLQLRNMTKRAKGKNVAQKSGLNKALLNVGIGKTFSLIEQKSKEKGRTFVRVNPAYTSQTCSVCKHVSSENRKTQSKFSCVSCGHTENADLNAAKNIAVL
jgi:putative transposase